MTAKNASATIDAVTLKIDLAKASEQDGGEIWFQVRWIVQDKNELSGEIDIYNSFSRNPLGRHARTPSTDVRGE
jgi:hypothetical protein